LTEHDDDMKSLLRGALA